MKKMTRCTVYSKESEELCIKTLEDTGKILDSTCAERTQVKGGLGGGLG